MPESGRPDRLARPDQLAARPDQLARAGEEARTRLAGTHQAREEGLAACRTAIQACGRAIRAVHRHQPEAYRQLVEEAQSALRRAQTALGPHPAVAWSGFLHDAEKEYAEACLTPVLVAGAVARAGGAEGVHRPGWPGSVGVGSGAVGASTTAVGAGPVRADGGPSGDGGPEVPDADALGVGLAAWLNGLAEAASELRRHLLDRLRAGELDLAEELLVAMEDVYDLLVTIDYPDAITGGLRRTTDALRAVLERSRADLTLTLVQARLQRALDRRPEG